MKSKLLKKVLMISKYTVLGALLQCLFLNIVLSNDGFTQKITSVRNVYINMEAQEMKIVDVFHEIEEKTDYVFLYHFNDINENQRVKIKGSKQTIADVFLDLSAQANIKFKQINNNINVKPKAGKSDKENLEVVIDGITITGKVTSKEDGIGLPGVNVIIKNASKGTVTDLNGNYEIEVVDVNAVLVFSSIGFEEQQHTVGNRAIIDIILAPDITALDEIVVIGYGEQKKVNLTGSVGTISSDQLAQGNSPNVENLLQGKIAGLQIVQNSGQPGDDGATMTIRGLGTFSDAGSSPLVLVDGVVGDLTYLSPENIESISVLKDAASSAIYGARGANGVILVTTKKGNSGRLNIQYSGNVQLQQATRLPDLVTNSADYMEYYNTARIRASQSEIFTQEEIDNYRNPSDPAKYPSYDWVGNTYNNAMAQNHLLSLNGGNENTSYNLSLGYLNQDGIAGGHGYQRYNLDLRVDTKVNEMVSGGAIIRLVKKDIVEPVFTDDIFMLTVYASNPTYGPYLPDGSGRLTKKYKPGSPSNSTPVSVQAMSSKEYNKYAVNAQSYIDVKLAKGLTWGVKGAVNFNNDFSKLHTFPVDLYDWATYAFSNEFVFMKGVTDRFDQSLLTTLYSTLHYENTFGQNHYLSALVGYNQESFKNNYLEGNRVEYPDASLTEINAGSPDGQSTNGTAYEWAIQSFFGRVNYDYKERYLLEANFRVDGSSRFPESNRWGFFPSFSGGWRLSNEDFMAEQKWLSNLKIRGSWGQLGNQNIGVYPYQDILDLTSYPYDALLEQGVVVNRLTDDNLKWESTTITDIGVDISIKRGLFSATFDWYNKITDDILYDIEVPASVGLASPTVNFAKMQNKGIELAVGHSNKVGSLRYDINANFSTNKNEVLTVKAPFYSTNNTIQEGLPWMSNYLVEWIGIFQSDAEIAEGPTHPFNPKPGDLKFKDQLTIDTNNDGIPDEADGVINGDDRIVVDGAYPDFFYGGGFNLFWNNFDFSAFFQGVHGQKFFVDRWGVVPFTQGAAPPKEFAENAWTPENKSNTHPAMYQDGYGPVTSTRSTYFLEDASYLRLKNLVIGYTISKDIVNKIGMQSLRVYLSGDNLFTITDYPGADPERLGVGRQRFATFPQLRIYTVGLKVTF